MIKIAADYYDGNSSARHAVTVSFMESGQVLISGEDIDKAYDIEQITIGQRVADTPRSLYLPDNGKLETTDNDAIDQVCDFFQRNLLHSLLHKLEKNSLYVLLAVLLTVATLWAGIEWGVPFAARKVAQAIPDSVAVEIAEQSLSTLDDWLLKPSTLPNQTRQHIRALFKKSLKNQSSSNLKLYFRNSPEIGANAFALPGGWIIMTDQLVKLAENDQQILAVLAHETGHVINRHGLRSLLQNSMTALFMAGALGDLTSVTSLSVTIPTLLVQNRYSREFERQADRYAVDQLKQQQIPPQALTRILTLLHQNSPADSQYSYLSSHPSLSERVKLIESAH